MNVKIFYTKLLLEWNMVLCFVISWDIIFLTQYNCFLLRDIIETFELEFKYQHEKNNDESYYIIWTAGHNPGKTLID